MNPYPDRIAELHQYLDQQFGHKDRQATEILLACLLDPATTRSRRPWIIIETDFPNRFTDDAWFSFGSTGADVLETQMIGGPYNRPDMVIPFEVRSMAIPRVQRSQTCESILQEWMSYRHCGAPGLFVDAEWRRMPTSGRGATLMMMTHSYAILLSMCLRLRVDHPKGLFGAQLDRESITQELGRLTRRVLDCSHRPSAARPLTSLTNLQMTSRSIPRTVDMPKSLPYWLELLQKLAPLQSDWEVLLGGLVTIVRNISLLYADDREADWDAVLRIIRDCIPYCTRWILEHVTDGRAKGIKAMQLFKQSGQVLDKPFTHEIRRLAREGVLLSRQNWKANDPYGYHPWRYRLGDGNIGQLLDRSVKLF